MKKGFSLIELIFVIVLIGVLSGIGFYLSRPDYARQDAQYTVLKLKEARYRSLGYDTYDPSGCVTLSATELSNNTAPSHTIKSTISVSYPTDPTLNTICFDGIGRPHDGNFTTLNTLIQTDLNITFTNGNKNTTIRLFCGTGYAIIPCQ